MAGLLDLNPGEFFLTDKMQPQGHLEERLKILREAYAKDPEMTRAVLSYTLPHRRGRYWTHEELAERLALPPVVEGAMKAAAWMLKEASSQFLAAHFPSVGAAWDAWDTSRAQQAAIEAQAEQLKYPALSFTQPRMMEYAMGGGQAAPPPVHHRRHRHHG